MAIDPIEIRIAVRLYAKDGKWCLAPMNQPTPLMKFDTIREAREFARGARWRIV
jgi:hypothetical protein